MIISLIDEIGCGFVIMSMEEGGDRGEGGAWGEITDERVAVAHRAGVAHDANALHPVHDAVHAAGATTRKDPGIVHHLIANPAPRVLLHPFQRHLCPPPPPTFSTRIQINFRCFFSFKKKKGKKKQKTKKILILFSR
jgi:hypothetical protein